MSPGFCLEILGSYGLYGYHMGSYGLVGVKRYVKTTHAEQFSFYREKAFNL